MADKPPLSALLSYYGSAGTGGLNGYQKVVADNNDAQSQAAFEAVKKYDPDARWEAVAGQGGQGGEGGSGGEGGAGFRLMYDQSKLPELKGGGSMDYVGATDKDTKLKKGAQVFNDEYGTYVNNKDRIVDQKTAWWEYAAPLLISMVAPMAGAALMAGGVGLGAAGTAAATSAAAGGVTGGMAAADAAAAMASGAGAAAGSGAGAGSSWGNDLLSRVAMKAPTIAKQINEGNFGWEQLLSTAAGAAGIPYAQLISPALALGKAGLAASKGTPTGTTTGGNTSTMDPRLLALIAAVAQRGR